MKELLQSILKREAEALLQIPLNEKYEEAIDLIIEKVHKQNGKLIVGGMGKAGQIGANIATTFASTGTPSFFLHPSEAQHGDLGIIQPNDVLLLVSNSGKTREILELIELAENLYHGLPLIVITGNPDSPLGKAADICLSTGNPTEVCPLGMTPTTSTTMMTVIGDLLVVGTMTKIGFTIEEYAKRHHGGYLGRKARHEDV
ncbi:MAG: SIS domain-containing protein [Bacteroidales bacterium]|nr:SIS domain-containing protein [Bacteroidales bacterium]